MIVLVVALLLVAKVGGSGKAGDARCHGNIEIDFICHRNIEAAFGLYARVGKILIKYFHVMIGARSQVLHIQPKQRSPTTSPLWLANSWK